MAEQVGLAVAFEAAVGLHQLEAHAAAREVLVGIGAVVALGVEAGGGLRQCVARRVVVADDEVDAEAARVFDLLDGLDAAVERYHEGAAGAVGVVDALGRDAVSFVVSVGNVEVEPVDVEMRAQERVDQRHRCGPVHVIVAVDQDALVAGGGQVDALDGRLHVFHQERVVLLAQVGSEERAGIVERRDATLDEQLSQHRVDVKLLRQTFYGLLVSLRLDAPSFFHSDSSTSSLCVCLSVGGRGGAVGMCGVLSVPWPANLRPVFDACNIS